MRQEVDQTSELFYREMKVSKSMAALTPTLSMDKTKERSKLSNVVMNLNKLRYQTKKSKFALKQEQVKERIMVAEEDTF